MSEMGLEVGRAGDGRLESGGTGDVGIARVM